MDGPVRAYGYKDGNDSSLLGGGNKYGGNILSRMLGINTQPQYFHWGSNLRRGDPCDRPSLFSQTHMLQLAF